MKRGEKRKRNRRLRTHPFGCVRSRHVTTSISRSMRLLHLTVVVLLLEAATSQQWNDRGSSSSANRRFAAPGSNNKYPAGAAHHPLEQPPGYAPDEKEENDDNDDRGNAYTDERGYPPWAGADFTETYPEDVVDEFDSEPILYKQWPPPPPGVPPGSSSAAQKYNPIHYQFESRYETQKHQKVPKNDEPYNEPPIPQTVHRLQEDESVYETTPNHRSSSSSLPRYASPRNDAVTKYISTSRRHAMTLFGSSTAVGAVLGMALGQSLLNSPTTFGMVGAALFAYSFVVLRHTPYGELVRTAGLTLVWLIQRSRHVRRQYPSWPHIKAVLGAGPRVPFPPGHSTNLWNYNSPPDDDNETAAPRVEFNMMYTLLAMAFVGSTCGGNMPFVPTWLGAVLGAASFGFLVTLPNARGDLARCMGMRVVATTGQLVEMNRELHLLRQLATVAGLILDKLLILDRKHRIKDRLLQGATFLYEQASRTVTQVQQQQQQKQAQRRRTPQDYDEYGDNRDDAGGGRDEYDDARRRRPSARRERPPPPADGSHRRDDREGLIRRGEYDDRRRSSSTTSPSAPPTQRRRMNASFDPSDDGPDTKRRPVDRKDDDNDRREDERSSKSVWRFGR